MLKRIIVLTCLFVSFTMLGCGREPVQFKLLRSMAGFDRVYVPAFFFTDLKKQDESEAAAKRLRETWIDFFAKYYNLEFKYGLNITDKNWKGDFREINKLIVTAEGMAKEGELENAHRELKAVREIFAELRHRNGLDYFPDALTAYDGALEKIDLFLKGKNKISEKDLERLRKLFKEAQAAWMEAGAANIDPRVFDFKPEKIMAVKKRVKAEEGALANFAAALSSRDQEKIFQSARDLRPNFALLYKAFGDFDPIFKQVKRKK